MRILVADGMDKKAMELLRSEGHEVIEYACPQESLGEELRDYDAVVVRSRSKVRAAEIDAAKGSRLHVVIRGGVGVDNIDVAYAEENGIAVRNTPKASTESVAEIAIAHMFSCARYISAATCSMRDGKWEKKTFGAGIELSGKTLGVIGFGRIGQRVAAIAKGIGMNIIANDIYQVPGLEEQMGMKYVDLDTLLAESDFISLHVPAINGVKLINAENIAKMKDGVVFINTSRGNNVDEAALIAALDSGKIRAAGLDVFEEEPTRNEALYTHPAVSCTPHLGGATKEAQGRIGMEIVEIIRSFAK